MTNDSSVGTGEPSPKGDGATRPISEVIADLRRPGTTIEWWHRDVAHEAADLLASLDHELKGARFDINTQTTIIERLTRRLEAALRSQL